MQGLVVDMLWFPLFHGFWPEWVPFVGGDYFEFFRFIFNIADAAITTGVIIILLFQGVFFKDNPEDVVAPNTAQ
jgi:signal peptidase II